jgi:Na+-transporting methylmalonyl-CoA/oxaloacetate decarboxylase gamma subunit
MESNIYNASMLLLIGMSTVFFILFILVSGGNVLIKLLNKVNVVSHELPFTKLTPDIVESSKQAAIYEAVHLLTQGKGRVDKIEKK